MNHHNFFFQTSIYHQKTISGASHLHIFPHVYANTQTYGKEGNINGKEQLPVEVYQGLIKESGIMSIQSHKLQTFLFNLQQRRIKRPYSHNYCQENFIPSIITTTNQPHLRIPQLQLQFIPHGVLFEVRRYHKLSAFLKIFFK